jgi:Zn-dependent protease/CBS domain-containing protein
VHASWFIIFGLLTWSLSTGYFPNAYPGLTLISHLILGLITTILFFASVLAHELGHALFALRNQIPVQGITLFIFGGIAQIAREPRSPGAEFRIAIAGPLVSLLLSGIFGVAYLLDQQIPFLAAPSEYLMRINFFLAVFNMIPGFPLDGGRVLRAFLWWRSGNFLKAHRIAAFSGQLVAFGFIGWGVLTIFEGNFLNGVWLAFIGWFLQNAAASSYAQTNMRESLSGIQVGQIMSQDCPRVTSLTPLSQLVDEQILGGGQRCFFVADNGKLEGVLTLKDIARIPQQKWRYTTTGQAMIPVSRLTTVESNTELMNALQTMDNADVAQVPVLKNGELVGILSRDQVVHYLRARAELGV